MDKALKPDPSGCTLAAFQNSFGLAGTHLDARSIQRFTSHLSPHA